MNSAACAIQRATHVRITASEMCEVHGWIPGSVYPTIDHEIWTPDKNGQQVYVESSAFKRPVQLFDTQYELINPIPSAMAKHHKTTDETLTVADRVQAVIENTLGVWPEDVRPNKHLQKDLGADSLDMLDVLANLEKEFDCSIPAEDAQKLLTVGDALDYFTERQGD